MATYVVDANVAVQAAIDVAGLGPLERHRLVAPTIMPSEALSSLAEMHIRGEISDQLAELARPRLRQFRIEVTSVDDLPERAWRIAKQLGWAKTYDAEYVALAQVLNCAVVTFDRRLARGAGRMVQILSPETVA